LLTFGFFDLFGFGSGSVFDFFDLFGFGSGSVFDFFDSFGVDFVFVSSCLYL
jgi:hypothetical protein